MLVALLPYITRESWRVTDRAAFFAVCGCHDNLWFVFLYAARCIEKRPCEKTFSFVKSRCLICHLRCCFSFKFTRTTISRLVGISLLLSYYEFDIPVLYRRLQFCNFKVVWRVTSNLVMLSIVSFFVFTIVLTRNMTTLYEIDEGRSITLLIHLINKEWRNGVLKMRAVIVGAGVGLT